MKRALFTLLAPLACAACQTQAGPGPSAPPGVSASSLTVTSKTFASKGTIPVDNSCDGSDRSPQLTWSSPPEGTKSIAIVAEDPDAPSGSFTHWVVYGVPPETTSIAEGVDPGTLGARVGMNDFKSVRYAGPCPPRRELHRYVFRVFALNAPIDLPEGATKETLYANLNAHVLAEGYAV